MCFAEESFTELTRLRLQFGSFSSGSVESQVIYDDRLQIASIHFELQK